MAYPERFDPVGVQVKITGLRRQGKDIPTPLCDYDSSESRHTASFECTPDGDGPFYRCHEHRPDAL